MITALKKIVSHSLRREPSWSFGNLCRGWLNRAGGPRCHRRRFALQAACLPVGRLIETCERRQMLTQFVVTSVADNELADGLLTLREAVVAANTNAPFRDAPAGSAEDQIVFHESLAGQRIVLQQPLSTIGHLSISGRVADSERVIIDGDDRHRLFAVGAESSLSLSGLVLEQGRADSGAAVRSLGDLSLHQVLVRQHQAEGDGGAIASFGTLALTDVVLTDNSAAGHGGAIFADGRVSMAASVMQRNTAGGNGGAVAAIDGGLQVLTSTVADNVAGGAGGGLFAQTTLQLQSSGVHDNRAGGSGGGVVSLAPQSVISNSTIAFNTTDAQGGGIVVAGSLTMVVSTVVRNRAGQAADGLQGGGVATAGTFTMASSLVLGNRSGPLAGTHDDLHTADGGTVTATYSVVGDPQSSAGVAATISNTVGADGGVLGAERVLQLERDPHATTLVFPLVAGSVAIDHGKAAQALDVQFAPLLTDQRGEPRVLFGRRDTAELDAGAFEFRPRAPVIQQIDTSEFLSEVTVAWQAGRSATHHELVLENLSSGQTGAQSLLIDREVAGTRRRLVNLPDGRYRVWVRAASEGGLSDWSVRTFRVSTRPDLHRADYLADQQRLALEWVGPPDTEVAEFYVVNRSLGHEPVIYQVDAAAGVSRDESLAAFVGTNDVWVRTRNSAGVWSRWSLPLRHHVVPRLRGPVGGRFDARPEFRWTDVRGAQSYDIWIQTGRDVLQVSGWNQSRFQPEQDLAVGDYRWWVRAEFPGGRTAWSGPLTFHPHGRTEVFPQKGGPVDSPVVDISLASVSGAELYELYVRHADRQEVVFHEVIGSQTQQRLPLPVIGQYEVWARAITAEGTRGTWSRPVIYKSNGRAFSNASVQTDWVPHSLNRRPTFRWDGGHGAETFDVVLWHAESQTEIKTQLAGRGVFIPPDNLRDGRWSWYVRGADAEGFVGEWVRGNDFLVGGQTQLTAPVLTDDQRPLIRWQPVEGAAGYQLAVFDDEQNEVLRLPNLAAVTTSIQPEQPLAIGGYRAWVRILLANGTFGPWSARHDFEVAE